MKTVKVFFCAPTDVERRFLRRYVSSGEEKCTVGSHGYHEARVRIEDGKVGDDGPDLLNAESGPAFDLRWPTACVCGRAFTPEDHWQLFTARVYRRSDTGGEIILNEAPPGACWDAEWMHDHPAFCGPDGRSLHVVCPDGHSWCIDGRAKNCTMPKDTEHKCWVRHGSPEAGDLTVDKNGKTCRAGAGSISTGTYHGFLRNGAFTAPL